MPVVNSCGVSLDNCQHILFITVAASTGSLSTPTGGSNKNTRPTSPASNVIVLPNGVQVHIKGKI